MGTYRKPALSKREAALLLAAVILAFSLAGWRFLISPLSQTASELRREHSALLLEQEQMLEQLQEGEALAAAREQWRPRAGALHTLIPSPEQLPAVLARLEALLGAFPAELQTLQSGEMETEETHAALPVKLRAHGEAAVLLALLERLEQFEHLLLVDQIGWSRTEGEAASLELSFRLIFHPPP